MTPQDPSKVMSTRHFDLAFDPATGAVVRLHPRGTGRDWATPAHPLALFTHETLSSESYDEFLKSYVTIQADWAPRDFGKPDICRTGAVAREWHARVLECHSATDAAGDRLCLQLGIDDPQAVATGDVAWPAQIFLELSLPSAKPQVELRFTSLGKSVNRLPEAMWLTFSPPGIPADGWCLEKVNETVMPLGGAGRGRAMHAVQDRPLRRRGGSRSRRAHAGCAGGRRTPLNFTLDRPDLSNGVHFSLFNNAWGTNYPQWCGGDWMYSFQLTN